MLVQSKPVVSQKITLTGITPGKFNFNFYFELGGKESTNLSRRCAGFYDSFQKNSLRQCVMPQTIRFIDVPEGCKATLKNFLKESHAFKEFWGLRVPIKLVGHMKNLQKNGEAGSLLVSGVTNVFLCRGSDNELHLVKMKYVPKDEKSPNSDSWKIKSHAFECEEVLEGPFRLFINSH